MIIGEEFKLKGGVKEERLKNMEFDIMLENKDEGKPFEDTPEQLQTSAINMNFSDFFFR